VGHLTEKLCIFETGIGDNPAVEVSSLRNRPSPFVDMTAISCVLTSGSPMNTFVYDIDGRLVTTLAEGVSLPEGNHEVTWNGSDMIGSVPGRDRETFRRRTGRFSRPWG
jgi:hypothetical protein